MADLLQKIFGTAVYEKADAAQTVGKIKGLATFFSDAIEATKDATAVKGLGKALPWWAEAAGSAAAEAIPVVKFAVLLFEKLVDEPNAQEVGLLACTLAYQQSVEEAIRWTGLPEAAKNASAEVRSSIASLDNSESLDFSTFSFRSALQHPFFENAEMMFRSYLDGVGYTDSQQRKLITYVRRRFVPNLRLILAHGKLQKRFKPFLDLIQVGDDLGTFDAIVRHVQYQRWLFEQAPMFETEPFALSDVYIDTECGVLTWGEIKGAAERSAENAAQRHEPVDAFSEKWGGRKSLLDTVISYLENKDFHDAIVVQGAAGSGKSSFTLQLCVHLERQGLYPIRIRLRDLPLNEPLDDALPKALFPPDHELPEPFQGGPGDDPFRKESIFREEIDFGAAKICPYVLILDGWDEISISATEGFKIRVARMLEEVRSRFLKNRGTDVRVILTGRPSAAVGESRFLLRDTPVLTIRPIRPSQLESFVDALRNALDQPRFLVHSSSSHWTVPPREDWQTIFERYEKDYQAKVDSELKGERLPEGAGSMNVLGLPLLAQLAIRLISEWKGKREDLIESPTTLYRHMVDLTCAKGGKSPHDKFGNEEGYFLTGHDLRRLLEKTAAAMTAYGEESISFRELALRLRLEDEELNRQATELSDNHVLSSLMISFFFKGGHLNLGCEFLHKSFREYLFAEAIVETLKKFVHPQGESRSRGEYWKDFDPGSELYDFSRALSELLAPQWLSPEVIRHLESLLVWEIKRSAGDELGSSSQSGGQPTGAIKIEEWEQVRDALAELWHWWGEGAHQRPQSQSKPGARKIELRPAYIEELVAHNLPYDPFQRRRRLAPARGTTMDGHLGDGLFRITAIVHFQVAKRRRWLVSERYQQQITPEKLWEDVSPRSSGKPRCQSIIRWNGCEWVFFAPAGEDPRYFDFYKARINAVGWRPTGPFPGGVCLDGVDLRGCNIAPPFNSQSTFRQHRASWRYANLSRSIGTLGFFEGNGFQFALLTGAKFEAGAFLQAGFQNVSAAGASFNFSNFTGCSFQNADLMAAQFKNARIEMTSFSGAKLRPGALRAAQIEGQQNDIPPHALESRDEQNEDTGVIGEAG